MIELASGDVAWTRLDPVIGREQGGRRPVLVVASDRYLDAVTTLVIVVPITTVDRGWTNHIAVTGSAGLARASWAMTEQPRTLSRERIIRVAGRADASCLEAVRMWLRDFLID